jgi:hypothetical protein
MHNSRWILWSTAASRTTLAILASVIVDVMEELLLRYKDLFAKSSGLPPTHQRIAIASASC